MKEKYFFVPNGDELKALRRKLNQDEGKLEHSLSLFLNWLTYQRHLPQNCDPNLLRNMIVIGKNDLEVAKKKYQGYCYAKLTNKEIVSDRTLTPESDLKCLEYMHAFLFPTMTLDGCRLFLIKICSMDTFELLPIIRYLGIIFDYMFHKDIVLAGLILIFDVGAIKPVHYSKVFSAMFFKWVKFGLAAYPLKVNKIILFALHPYLEKGITLCKTILPQKISGRIIIVKDTDELLELIPPSDLPSDYGGSLKSIKELCFQYSECLIENEQFLRKISQDVPTGPIPKEFVLYENEFGIDGSFRQLNID